MLKVVKYVCIDILRSRVVVAYTLCLLALSFSLFSLEDNTAKGMLSLLNITLLLVPLVSVIFSTIYIYNSSEFIELLLAQPIKRSSLLLSVFAGLLISLLIAYFIGAGIPLIIMVGDSAALFMLLSGSLLTAVFVSLALLASVYTRDKAKGIGVSIMMWLVFSLLYDGLLLFIMFQLSDYPLEKVMIFLTSFNPVDLARILMLLKLDTSALMGYTGAVFNNFFGTQYGVIYSTSIMLVWIILPVMLALKKFRKKDL
jgi:Cu-processing system permease protein